MMIVSRRAKEKHHLDRLGLKIRDKVGCEINNKVNRCHSGLRTKRNCGTVEDDILLKADLQSGGAGESV